MPNSNIPNGSGYKSIKHLKQANRADLDMATQITVMIYGADKVSVLMDNVAKLAHFSYAMGGFTVEMSEANDADEFTVTVSGLQPGMAFYFGIIGLRLAGRQQGIKAASALTVYGQRSKIRKQFVKQFAPSVCAHGSDLRDCTDDILFGNAGYVEYLHPIFECFGLYSYGSCEVPA